MGIMSDSVYTSGKVTLQWIEMKRSRSRLCVFLPLGAWGFEVEIASAQPDKGAASAHCTAFAGLRGIIGRHFGI